jgi:hypothetical protein
MKQRFDADVFIQAGHEGRTSGKTGAPGSFGDEIDWTPVVADEATKELRLAGLSVIRMPADFQGVFRVKIALFIHFDGSKVPCSSGASIGYNDPTDQPAAEVWKNLYREHWPFRWNRDSFTTNLSNYYAYGQTITTDAELVLELGEISCDEQAAWMKPNLQWMGKLIAHFVALRMGMNKPIHPGNPVNIDE